MTQEKEIRAGEHATFENFLPYIHIDGLDNTIQIDFLNFLKLFHLGTMNDWLPGRCNEIVQYESYAVQILQTLPVLNQHYQVTRHKFRLWHQWINLESDQLPTLVVDPTGIPLNFDHNPVNLVIVHHFVLIEQAHRYAQEEYNLA